MTLLPASSVLVLVSALAWGSASQRQPLHAQFDHLVVAIRSLSDGMRQFEELTGVKPVVGGKHPGRGTENALVSLGAGKYLEIIAPQPDVQLSATDAPMRQLDTLTILTWAVSVSDVEEAKRRVTAVGIAPGESRAGSRITPAGSRLEWTTFALAGGAAGAAPFFIAWSEGTQHPSTTAPGGCTLQSLAVQDPAAEELSRVLQGLGVADAVVKAGPVRIEASLACAKGIVRLSSR